MDTKTFAEKFRRPRMGRRLLTLMLSLTAMGASLAMFRLVGFGTDPCSTFSVGVSGRTGISFGTCQLMFNLLMFIPVLRFDLSRIGIGTVGNMVGVGYVADFCIYLLKGILPKDGFSLGMRFLIFALSMAVFLVAASFYIVVDLGVAPYDAIPQLIAAHTDRLSRRGVRMLWDVSVLSAGFLLGATVGLTTLITGFFLGPAITMVSNRVHGWFE